MYADIFAILAPIAICTLIGYCWARSGVPFEGEFVTRLVMNIGAPCLVIGTLSKADMPAESLAEIMTAAAVVLIITGLIALGLCKLFKLPATVYLAPLSFPNTVNMGLPVCFFAFGEQGLAVALGIYIVVSLTQFTVGIALVSGQSAWKNTLRSPIVYSGLIAIALIVTATRLPLWLENSVNLLGSLSIPIMLMTQGVSLSQLRVRDFTVSCLLGLARLILGVAVGFLVAELLALEGTIRGVVIIQSAMPAAVFNYLLARRYKRSPEAVAGLVVMSTLFSFASLPVLLWLVL